MASLRQRTDQVVADKKLMKAMTTYAEEKRDLLAVTIFNGKAELTTSPGIAKLLEKETHLIEGLMKVFEEKAKRDREVFLAGVKPEDDELKPELRTNKHETLPPLFAPFKNEEKGWTKCNVADQLTLYINLKNHQKFAFTARLDRELILTCDKIFARDIFGNKMKTDAKS